MTFPEIAEQNDLGNMLEHLLYLNEELSNGLFTVFAPTDAAVDAFFDQINALNDENLQIIWYFIRWHHTSGGAYTIDDLATLDPPILLVTSVGQLIGVDLSDDGIFVVGVVNNQSYIAQADPVDIIVSNVVVHVVDQVILPLVPLATTAAMYGFSILSQAFDAANLTSFLNDMSIEPEDTFTIFAPTDAAFLALGQDALASLFEDTERLTNILLAHVVPGTETISTIIDDLSIGLDGYLTVASEVIAPFVEDDSLFVQLLGSVSHSAQVGFEFNASNGVIHAIDAVLLLE